MLEVRVAIVGSRRRSSLADYRVVSELIQKLLKKTTDSGKTLVLVSGGCRGPDKFAEQAAEYAGIRGQMVVFPAVKPGDPPVVGRWDFRNRAFARNRDIAEYATHGVFALVAPDRTGGTENTLEHAREFGRKVMVHTHECGWIFDPKGA